MVVSLNLMYRISYESNVISCLHYISLYVPTSVNLSTINKVKRRKADRMNNKNYKTIANEIDTIKRI